MASLPPSFTSHNIALPDGTHTRPGEPLLADTQLCKAVLRDLAILAYGAARPISVADLGCLEGGYTAELARAGYLAEGVEARDDNYQCCEHVRRQLQLPGLSFTHADARAHVPGRRWDAVFCNGLLYHLDEPAKFLHQLGDATGLLILGTHYSAHPDAQHEGYIGHWEPEFPSRWSSHGNGESFWMARQSIVACLRDAGFATVWEQLDHMQDGAVYVDHHGEPYHDRCVLVAVKG